MSYFLTPAMRPGPQRPLRRALKAVNGLFAAGLLLAPAAIFAAPAPSNLGFVTVDGEAAGNPAIADTTFTSTDQGTYVHGFQVVDSAGTYEVDDATSKPVVGGAWHATKSKGGNGFDFNVGPLAIGAGSYTVKVKDSTGLSDKEGTKSFSVTSSTPSDEDTGPFADSNSGTIKLHPIGPCPDLNAEVLNHDPSKLGGCGYVGFEPSNEATQNAEIGTVEPVTMRHVPHLPCENIEVMGSGLADETGNYSIDVWPPTGNKTPVYGKDSAGHSVLGAGMEPGDVGFNGASVYNHTAGGLQVMDIVDVDALVHNAIVAGAQPHPIQGYHFKVQFNQGADQAGNSKKEQKHKTFWVKCTAADVTPPPCVPSVANNNCGNGFPPPVCVPSPANNNCGQGGGTPPPCTETGNMLQSFNYTINGKTVDRLEGNVSPGDHVTVNFTLAGECSNHVYSLAAYQAPSATFSRDTASQQVLSSQDTGSFGNGVHSLSVTVPSCFYQVDFVSGPVIEHLGPANSTNFYSDQNRLIDAENGGTTSCTPAPPGHTPAPILGIVKTVAPSTSPVPAGTELVYTVTLSNTGDAAANNVAVTDVINANPADMFSVVGSSFSEIPAAPHSTVTNTSRGQYLWEIDTIAAGGTATLSFGVDALTAGTITNTAAIVGGPTSAVTTVVNPVEKGTLAATIEYAGTTTKAPGGTITFGGANTSTYPATYPGLVPGTYCVSATAPSGYNMVGDSQQCAPVTANQVTNVVFFVAAPAQQTTACVPVTIELAGTTTTVPGGQVAIGSVSQGTYPHTFCDLTPGSTTATAVAPANYTLVGPASQSETLVAGNNPPIVFFVQPNGEGTGGAECGQVMGNIVLAGTSTTIPGGTISSGGVNDSTYPALFPCVSPGSVTVVASAPSGYQFVGPSTSNATIVAGQVTPVIFQVTPITNPGGDTGGTGTGNPGGTGAGNPGGTGAGNPGGTGAGNPGGTGAGNPGGTGTPNSGHQDSSTGQTGVQGVLGVKTADHAPTSGVLGTSIGMPITGSEAILRVGFSVLCISLGLVFVMSTVRNRRAY